jgi:hypothetical protein
VVVDILVGVPVADELRVLADRFEVVAPVVFVVASLGFILWSARRRPPASPLGSLPGLRPALITGVLVSMPLTFLRAVIAWWFGIGDLQIASHPGPEQFAGAFLITALSMLDLYAIRPPLRHTLGFAAGRATLGVILAIVLFVSWSGIIDGLNSAAMDEDRAAERRAVEARSAGLSMHVEVVNATVGETHGHGRVVSYLTLDITVRSTTQIHVSRLSEFSPDYLGARIKPAASRLAYFDEADRVVFEVTKGLLGLPANIPAGFDETYRVEAPLTTSEYEDFFTTGTWEARLSLISPDEQMYEVSTVFTVPDTP